MNSMNGLIIIDKPKDFTSRDIVDIVGKKLNTKKIGHTGTLDPIATGVLVLCINEATKLVEIITFDDKEYVAEVMLGLTTDTLDITGKVVEEKKALISKEDIEKVLKQMEGTYLQEVPIYSAIKVKGQKLYEYARKGEVVSLPKKEVEIKKLELVSEVKHVDNKTVFSIKAVVSKGTYIRSLIRDIAYNLNTIGVMAELRRTRQGKYTLDDAYTLEDIEKGEYKIINIDKDFFNYKCVKVNKNVKMKIKYGSLLENKYEDDVILFIDEHDKILALYKTYQKDKSFLKPWKMFKEGM